MLRHGCRCSCRSYDAAARRRRRCRQPARPPRGPGSTPSPLRRPGDTMCPCHHCPAPALCCDAACTGTNATHAPTPLSSYPRQARDPLHWHSMGSRAGSFASAGRGSVTAVSGGNGNGGGRSNTSSTTAARSNVEAEAAAKVQTHSCPVFSLLGSGMCSYPHIVYTAYAPVAPEAIETRSIKSAARQSSA